MRNQKIFLIAAFWLAGLMPVTSRAQSDTSSQEIQALRKQLDEMRAQMNNMQAKLDQLEATKAEPSANQPTGSAPVSSQKQNGTIQTNQPMPQGPASPHNIPGIIVAPKTSASTPDPHSLNLGLANCPATSTDGAPQYTEGFDEKIH